MIDRRSILAAAIAALSPSIPFAAAPAEGSPAATIETFYQTLLSTMKEGQSLGFAGRRERLAPAIKQAFDLPLMTRLMVGPQWQALPPEQQQRLVDAFTDFSIATYANRFDDYSGEKFQVDPQAAPGANGAATVHTRLVKSDGEPVTLDYQMRDSSGNWRIVDVYLAGTVSELATRRSEFSAVLRRGGAEALVDLLQQKTAQLRG
jgi:phospholipid transport system substrate-binding protein